MIYKVMFHEGKNVSLATKVRVGRLTLLDGRLSIEGDAHISVPHESLRSVELFRLHNTGRMLKIEHDGGTLFVSVIRFIMFSHFAVGNFFGTGKLKKELQKIIADRPSI
ncbi:MAG: hypothetical protein JSS49_04310 [Planctomycetes bacterium]|nr:hypothetical protein [Planctomycetota bacterium]